MTLLFTKLKKKQNFKKKIVIQDTTIIISLQVMHLPREAFLKKVQMVSPSHSFI